MKTLTVWFDYLSPYAFLAWQQLPELVREHGLALKPVPVLFGGLLKHMGTLGPAEIPAKRTWVYTDALRSAAIQGIMMQFPPTHPFKPLAALRATVKVARDAPDKLEAVFRRVERLCIVGHTHVPGVFTDEPDFYPPDELGEFAYRFTDEEKAIINVGSVGQPRAGDPRASYVILHEDRAEFLRVPYDIDVTAKKIREQPQLHDWLGERLYEGR